MNEVSQVSRVRLHLLDELRTGTLRPGAAISIKATAAALRTSHTPVREALERLVGEGVLQPVGERQGFRVARYGTRDLADLHRLLEVLVQSALGGIPRPIAQVPALGSSASSHPAVAETIGVVASNTDNRMVSAAIVRTSTLLAPYRRAEPLVLPDWLGNLNSFRESLATGRGSIKALHAFTKLRTTNINRLVDASDDISDIHQV